MRCYGGKRQLRRWSRNPINKKVMRNLLEGRKYKGYPPSTREAIISLVDERDPTPTGYYANWILQNLLREMLEISDIADALNERSLSILHEDSSKVRGWLEDYEELSKNNKAIKRNYPLSRKGLSTTDQLFELLKRLLPDKYALTAIAHGLPGVMEYKVSDDMCRTLYDIDPDNLRPLPEYSTIKCKYRILKFEGEEAIPSLMKTAQGTKWCTEKESAAKHYLSENPVIVISKHVHPVDEPFVQAHIGLDHGLQIKDIEDDDIENGAAWVDKTVKILLGSIRFFERALTFYEKKLTSPSVKVRESAVRGLGDYGRKEAIPILVKTAISTDDYSVRSAAVSSLGRIEQKEAAADALVYIFNHAKPSYVVDTESKLRNWRLDDLERDLLDEGYEPRVAFLAAMQFEEFLEEVVTAIGNAGGAKEVAFLADLMNSWELKLDWLRKEFPEGRWSIEDGVDRISLREMIDALKDDPRNPLRGILAANRAFSAIGSIAGGFQDRGDRQWDSEAVTLAIPIFVSALMQDPAWPGEGAPPQGTGRFAAPSSRATSAFGGWSSKIILAIRYLGHTLSILAIPPLTSALQDPNLGAKADRDAAAKEAQDDIRTNIVRALVNLGRGVDSEGRVSRQEHEMRERYGSVSGASGRSVELTEAAIYALITAIEGPDPIGQHTGVIEGDLVLAVWRKKAVEGLAELLRLRNVTYATRNRGLATMGKVLNSPANSARGMTPPFAGGTMFKYPQTPAQKALASLSPSRSRVHEAALKGLSSIALVISHPFDLPIFIDAISYICPTIQFGSLNTLRRAAAFEVKQLAGALHSRANMRIQSEREKLRTEERRMPAEELIESISGLTAAINALSKCAIPPLLHMIKTSWPNFMEHLDQDTSWEVFEKITHWARRDRRRALAVLLRIGGPEALYALEEAREGPSHADPKELASWRSYIDSEIGQLRSYRAYVELGAAGLQAWLPIVRVAYWPWSLEITQCQYCDSFLMDGVCSGNCDLIGPRLRSTPWLYPRSDFTGPGLPP